MIRTWTLAPKELKVCSRTQMSYHNVIHAITETHGAKTRGRSNEAFSNEGRESEERALDKASQMSSHLSLVLKRWIREKSISRGGKMKRK